MSDKKGMKVELIRGNGNKR